MSDGSVTISGTFPVEAEELSVNVSFTSDVPEWFDALKKQWREREGEVPGVKVFPGPLGVGVEYRGVESSLNRAYVLLGWSMGVLGDFAADEGCEIDAKIMTFYKWPP